MFALITRFFLLKELEMPVSEETFLLPGTALCDYVLYNDMNVLYTPPTPISAGSRDSLQYHYQSANLTWLRFH